MATHDVSPEGDGIQALFESSPDLGVHTSAAAEGGFLLGLAATVAAPFSVMHAVALACAVVAVVLAFVGVVTTSHANVAGRALAPLGLLLALVALALVSLRYLGVDTSFGDGMLPALAELLEQLNARAGVS